MNAPKSPREFIGELPDEYLTCRELGHSWRQNSLGRSDAWGFLRVLMCTSCGKERHDRLDTYGRRVDRPRYFQPEGYGFKGASRWNIGREDFRREVLRRAGFEVRERVNWQEPTPEERPALRRVV